jgi:hypothetical protein
MLFIKFLPLNESVLKAKMVACRAKAAAASQKEVAGIRKKAVWDAKSEEEKFAEWLGIRRQAEFELQMQLANKEVPAEAQIPELKVRSFCLLRMGSASYDVKEEQDNEFILSALVLNDLRDMGVSDIFGKVYEQLLPVVMNVKNEAYQALRLLVQDYIADANGSNKKKKLVVKKEKKSAPYSQDGAGYSSILGQGFSLCQIWCGWEDKYEQFVLVDAQEGFVVHEAFFPLIAQKMQTQRTKGGRYCYLDIRAKDFALLEELNAIPWATSVTVIFENLRKSSDFLEQSDRFVLRVVLQERLSFSQGGIPASQDVYQWIIDRQQEIQSAYDATYSEFSHEPVPQMVIDEVVGMTRRFGGVCWSFVSRVADQVRLRAAKRGYNLDLPTHMPLPRAVAGGFVETKLTSVCGVVQKLDLILDIDRAQEKRQTVGDVVVPGEQYEKWIVGHVRQLEDYLLFLSVMWSKPSLWGEIITSHEGYMFSFFKDFGLEEELWKRSRVVYDLFREPWEGDKTCEVFDEETREECLDFLQLLSSHFGDLVGELSRQVMQMSRFGISTDKMQLENKGGSWQEELLQRPRAKGEYLN